MLQPHGYVEEGTKVTDTRHYKSQMLIGENSRIFFLWGPQLCTYVYGNFAANQMSW